MKMTPVTREQFEFESNLMVIHKPTGASFSTYEYDDPENVGSDIKMNWGRAGDVLESGEDYDRGEVGKIAVQAAKRSAKRRKARPRRQPP
jgi:hypothetical protein